ncbi:MAG: hypothetical protein GKR89_19185 [Candidatus Latescibacteria bacterium]|nr:hypothetical protein [Candidatus Latescibacterota bacterium]
MIKKQWMVAGLAIVAMAFSGCAQAGLFPAANLTSVQLAESNYKIVATDIEGESEAAYLVGISFSSGMSSQSVALHKVKGTGMLYREAMDALWRNYEETHGPVVGKSLALVNVRYDADNLNLLAYTRAKLSIRADVVEFVDD